MSQPKSNPSRRALFVGAGAVGAAAAAVAVLPVALPQEEKTSELKPPPERGGGYQVTEHVKRYYKSTLV